MNAVEMSPVILDSDGKFGSGPTLNSDHDEDMNESNFFGSEPMSHDGCGNIRAHLNDLATRHPEFANQLRGPAWGDEMWMGDGDGASASASASSSSGEQPQEQGDEPGPLRGRARNNLPQHGLRNTVPDMGQRQQAEESKEETRGQRSWSAPPDNRSPKEQKFVSRININPVNPDDITSQQPPQTQAPDSQGKPPPVPKPQQQQPTQQQSQQPKPASNVRHIPIFVEGRDEPILPKNLETDSDPPQFTSHAQHQFQPQPTRPFPQQKRPFQTSQNNTTPPQQKQPNRSFNTSPKPFQQPAMNQQPEVPQPSQHQPKPVNDPISKVHFIQQEVNALRQQVEQYSGNSRNDKNYVYLDEMLTRNLIKLDDIETEGKENIRQARKDAIRSIQQCINILEEKVPLPQDTVQPMECSVEGGGGQPETETEPNETLMEMAQEDSKVGESSDVLMEGSDKNEVKTKPTEETSETPTS